MSIKTKVISTLIAIVCSLSVSATGISAILMNFDVQVAQTTSLELSNVSGDLYGERTGADNTPLTMHLFKNGEGVQEAEMRYFCKDVNFSTGSNEITYVFKFILAEGADDVVMVNLESAELTNSTLYTAEYNVARGMAEPDWKTAEQMTKFTKYIVDDDNPYLWLRATLKVNTDQISRVIDSRATWSFQFMFEGVTLNNGT